MRPDRVNGSMHSALVLVRTVAGERRERLHQALVRSLAALVPALMEDCLREATLVGAPDLGLADIADHAGCGLSVDADPARAFESALAAARCDRVFVLEAGYAPLAGFIDELKELEGARGAFALRLAPDGLLARLAPRLSPVVGLSAPRRACMARGFAGAAAAAGGLGARTLATRARRV